MHSWQSLPAGLDGGSRSLSGGRWERASPWLWCHGVCLCVALATHGHSDGPLSCGQRHGSGQAGRSSKFRKNRGIAFQDLQTIGKSGGQRRRASFYRGKRKLGGVVLNNSS